MRHWFRRWFRRLHRRPQQPAARRRLQLESLEDRCLLAAPVIDPLQVPLNIPTGKSLVVPVSASDADGGSVSYSVTSSNPDVTVQQLTGNTFLKLTVQGFGTMEFELFNNFTPQTAGLIAGMAKSGFYDGLTFHRVLSNFVIQGGDPAGTGTGGPGFTFDDEFNSNLIYSGTGQLGMANTGKDTNGSQFFVTIGTQRDLDFNNAIFGQLIRGFDVLQAIEAVPVDSNDKPTTPVVITNAEIVQDNTDAVFLLTSTGTTADSTTLTITATSSEGQTTTQTESATVFADTTNDPPILGPVSDQVSADGSPVTFNLTRTDTENDPSTFEANLVNAADANNVSVTVTPSTNNDSATVVVTPKTVNGVPFTGSVQLLVGVEQTNATARGTTSNPFDTQQITVSFGDQPLTFAASASISATEGTAASGVSLGTLTDADTTSAASDFTVAINWGDGSPLDKTTGTLTAVSGTPGEFTVTGTHTYAHAGTFPVQVTITDRHTSATAGGDNGGATAQGSTTADVAYAALTATGGTLTATAGTPLSNAAVAAFTDADPFGAASDYTATINWQDGSSSTGTVQSSGNGQFEVLGSHTYAAQGTFAPAVTISDLNTAGDATPTTTTANATATVDPPLTSTTPTLTAAQQYVTQLFEDLTGQGPTVDQLNAFSPQVVTAAGRQTVAQQIQALPAYLSHEVQQAYLGLVGTAPTAQQLSDGVQFLQGGGDIGGLRMELVASPTFFSLQGGGTKAGFVQAVAGKILQVSLSAATQRHLVQELAGGTSRLKLIQEIIRLDRQQVRQQQVQDLYQQYLHRAATAAEVSNQLPLLAQGQEAAIIASLVSLDEYYNKTTTSTHPASTTTLTSSANPASFGEAVTFTAVVTGPSGAATPTGSVTFQDQTTGAILGTGTLDPTGTATFSTSALAVGTHTILASYGGSAGLATSSTTVTETVNQAGTVTTATSSVSTSVSGQAVTFTATVSALPPGAGTPTGTVTFTDTTSGAFLGRATLTSGGTATFTTSTLAVGTDTVSAAYSGDTNFTASNSTASQTVSTASTTTTLTASANPSTSGQSVTLTATVAATAPGTGTPTGTVTFTGASGTQLGTGTLSDGKATVTVSSLAVGTQTLTATYGGDTNFAGSAGTLSQTVNTAGTTTSLTSSLNPSESGDEVTFTATVTTSAGTGTPTGTVTFEDGGTTLGTGTLDGTGTATFSTPGLDAGTHSITAVYGGDGNFAASTSAALTQTVTGTAATATALTSSVNPSAFGQAVTFTGTVTPTSGSGTPTGTVIFEDGGTTLGTGTLDGNGQATFTTTSPLAVGVHNVNATYGGDATFAGSDDALTQNVTAADTTTTVTSSANPSPVGEEVTFTATVAPTVGGAGTPTGSVTFKDTTSGAVLGTVNLESNGQATVSTNGLEAGTDTITASYAGDGNFAASDGSFAETVGAVTTSTALASSENPSMAGDQVTFTATVTASAGSATPTGTVEFVDQGTGNQLGTGTLDGNGQATFAIDSLAPGSYIIEAIYQGSTNFVSSSGTLPQTVTGTAATITALTSSDNPSANGAQVTFTATVTPVSGSGTPTGVVTFVDQSMNNTPLGTGNLDGNGQATLMTGSLAPGTHTIVASYGGDDTFAVSSGSLDQMVNS
jgi:cyclophilin family peptidyl-prolyl cis-trans isomerase